MASLVADYSSDSDSEDACLPTDTKVKEEVQIKEEIKEPPTTHLKEQIKEELSTIPIKQEIKEEPSALPSASSNFFCASDVASDDENGDENDITTSIKTKKEKPANITSKLPSLSEVNPGVIGSSVFVNPFERAEQAKTQILQKHVKLTEAAPQKPASQPVCWKFKKGKCHMGKNCRFFHAVDNLSIEDGSNHSTNDKNNWNNIMSSDLNSTHRSPYHPAAYMDARRRPLDVEPEDDDNYMANMKKKKRVGVNDRLVPPKKAFDALMEMRKKERPWTMPGHPS